MSNEKQVVEAGSGWVRGFFAVMLMVTLFSAFLWWVWTAKGGVILPENRQEVGGHGSAHGADQGEEHSEESAVEEAPAVAVSHPIVSVPAIGSGLTGGMNRFSGFAEPGTRVVLFGDGAEMANGMTAENGTWLFDVDIQAPAPAVFSVKFYDEAGQVVHNEQDLKLSFVASEGAVVTAFALLRPIDKGSVAKGSWVIAGTGKPGSSVELKMDRWVLGEAVVGEDGTWTFPRTINEAGDSRQLIAREIEGFGESVITHEIRVVE